MKSFFAFILAFSLCFSCVIGMAENDLGINPIGNPSAKSNPLSLDDIQIGTLYTIDGYANLVPVEFKFVDCFAQFNKDADYFDMYKKYQGGKSSDVGLDDWGYGFRQAYWNDSGLNAEYAWLQIDITNLQQKSIDYLTCTSIEVVYGDEYRFDGWVRQGNMDYSNRVYRYKWEGTLGSFCVLDSVNAEPIHMMYTGNYIFGCTLPNAVVTEMKNPLKMVIHIGDNEIIYNIRK